MKIITLLLLVGLSLSGCFTPTPGEKAYSACLDSVPEDIKRAAEGEFDLYHETTQTALTKSNPITSMDTTISQPWCSPDCEVAREEQQRIVSECYDQWQKVQSSFSSDMEMVPSEPK
ncbi:hypothetical protein [Nitrospira sp. M1]